MRLVRLQRSRSHTFARFVSLFLLISVVIQPTSLLAQPSQSEKDLLLYVVTCWQQQADFDDCIAPHINLENHEVGFRIGLPILRQFVQANSEWTIKNTKYNDIRVHHVTLQEITDSDLVIDYSVRWQKFENNPLRVCTPLGCAGGPETYKRAEVNCDGRVAASLAVDDDHSISITQPAIPAPDCSTSGIGFEEGFDYITQGLTWIVSGGQESFGLYDLIGTFSSMLFAWVDAFDPIEITVTDPITLDLLDYELFQFINTVIQLDSENSEVFLSRIEHDPKGVLLIFNYPEQLNSIFQPFQSLVTNGGLDVISYEDAILRATGPRWVAKLNNGNRDFQSGYYFDRRDVGGEGELPLIGDFNGDGYDDFGLYIPTPSDGGNPRWVAKLNNGNRDFLSGYYFDRRDIGGTGEWPIIGDFNGDGYDDFGLYIPNPSDGEGPRWVAKLNRGNGIFQSEYYFDRRDVGGIGEEPIIGDFNGDGYDDFGLYIPNPPDGEGPRWVAKLNIGNGNFSGEYYFDQRDVGGVGEQPLIGDFNGDGYDDFGLYIPTPSDNGKPRWVSKLNIGNGNFQSGYYFDRRDVGGVGEWPIIGDFNRDGYDDFGLYIPTPE